MIRRILLVLLFALPAENTLEAQNALHTQSASLSADQAYLKMSIPRNLHRAIDNYRAALLSENCGLVESGMYYAVQLRSLCPRENLSCLCDALKRLSTNGATVAIRCKAMLALFAWDNPERIPGDDAAWNSTGDFFLLLARNIETALLDDGTP